MSKQRRTFSAEFKREAAALVLDQGYSHIEACRSLGIMDSALRRWVKQLQDERQGVTPKSKALTPEQQKIQELEASINRLEREKADLLNRLKGRRSEDKGSRQVARREGRTDPQGARGAACAQGRARQGAPVPRATRP